VPGMSVTDFDVLHVSSAPDIIDRDRFGGVGYVPSGWISLSLMNGGFLWLLGKSVIIGLTAAFLSNRNYDLVVKDSRVVFFYFVVFYLWERIFVINEALNVGAGYIGYYVLLILLPLFVNVSLRRIV